MPPRIATAFVKEIDTAPIAQHESETTLRIHEAEEGMVSPKKQKAPSSEHRCTSILSNPSTFPRLKMFIAKGSTM